MKRIKMYTLNAGSQTSAKVALQLTQSPGRVVYRFTGGFGEMSIEDGQRGVRVIAEAFRGFDGSIIFGGTRVVKMSDPSYVFPTMGEIPFMIHQTSPEAKILGIVPKEEDFEWDPELGLFILGTNPERDQLTIIHPDQDMCLQVQKNVDDPSPWDAEVRESKELIQLLMTYARREPCLVSYNGGNVTRREILEWADLGWPILLIRGGGRETDKFANDAEWIRSQNTKREHVFVADCTIPSIRRIVFPSEEKIIYAAERFAANAHRSLHSEASGGDASRGS